VSDLTPEELDEARIEEATRRAKPDILAFGGKTFAHHLCDVFNEGWTPPPKVDPDLLAAREWGATTEWGYAPHYAEGVYDEEPEIIGFLAGIKHGTASANRALLDALIAGSDALAAYDKAKGETQ
jgi:hypothetical protein